MLMVHYLRRGRAVCQDLPMGNLRIAIQDTKVGEKMVKEHKSKKYTGKELALLLKQEKDRKQRGDLLTKKRESVDFNRSAEVQDCSILQNHRIAVFCNFAESWHWV